MKKNIRLALLAALILTLGSIGSVFAEIIPPYGEGQIGLQAVVLCEELTVRQEPKASSKAVMTLKYGTRFSVQKQSDGWADCFPSDASDAGPAGWVNMDYIVIDPAWYRTDASTPVYAWNDTSAPKVALLDRDTLLPVLKDNGDWIVVSLRGATGWIRRPNGTASAAPAAPAPAPAAVPAPAVPSGMQDGQRYYGTVILEGMAETVGYEHVRNDTIGIEMDYEYDSFVRVSEEGRECFISRYEDLKNPGIYLEIRYSTQSAEEVAASIGASLSRDYEIVLEPCTLELAGSCTRIDASAGRDGQGASAMQTVYVIPAADGCRVAMAHYTYESADGFGARFRNMMNTLTVIGGRAN